MAYSGPHKMTTKSNAFLCDNNGSKHGQTICTYACTNNWYLVSYEWVYHKCHISVLDLIIIPSWYIIATLEEEWKINTVESLSLTRKCVKIFLPQLQWKHEALPGIKYIFVIQYYCCIVGFVQTKCCGVLVYQMAILVIVLLLKLCVGERGCYLMFSFSVIV